MSTEFRFSDWPVRVSIKEKQALQHQQSSNWYTVTWPNYSDWCNATYGRGNWEYYYGQFLFKNEKDALMFRLKWI